MKTYFKGLIFLIILISACADGKKEPVNKNESINSKDSKPADLASKGLENLSASSNTRDIICQVWDYAEDVKDAVGADPSSNIDFVHRGFCIYKDGNMIKDQRGNMQTGKWSLDEKAKPAVISFSLSNGKTETYQVVNIIPHEMILSRMEGSKKMTIELTASAIRHTVLENDPFYISNNAWRFKPNKPESDAQIKARLKNSLHFFVLLYDEKINAGLSTISFIGLPSCFKWYGGGIILQKENMLQDKWVNTFYDEDQAMKAYKLADKLISKKYDWPKKERNWLKLNVAVLRQMENKIDSL